MDRGTALHHPLVEEKAMPSKPGDVSVDGLGGDLQITSNLAVSHSSGGFHEDLSVELGKLLPVSGGKGLGAEAPFTGLAGKPLDTMRGGQSPEEANLLVGPPVSGIVVVSAVGIGAEGRDP
jgi:hypothetical protein